MSETEDIRPRATADLRHARMLIDGAWVDSRSGATLTVENPAKRRPIAEIPRGDAADVNAAVEAAARAFPAWSKVAPRDRGRLLLRIADKIEAQAEALAHLIALETGNALRTQARGEARLAADMFRYFGGLAGELKGETIPLGEQVLS
ncbi:MAG: aldehyde dehydrogenase family protein, partial [Bradyrhizobium sp.]